VLYLDVFSWVTGARNLLQQNLRNSARLGQTRQSRGDDQYTPLPSTGDSEAGDTRPSTPELELGVSPSDAYHPAFRPGSYAARTDDDNHEVVTGHGKAHPGVLPAKIFRSGTQVLITLWFFGVALSIGRFHDLTVPLGEAAEEVGPGGAQLEEVQNEPSHTTSAKPAALPMLLGGEPIQVRWPSHAGFVPRSLSCSPAGSQLVISDDFALYVGELDLRETLPATHANLSVAFMRMPPCSALDGHELQDIGVSCQNAKHPSCRVYVLHDEGRRISECKLPALTQRPSMSSSNAVATEDVRPAGTKQETGRTMAVSTSWLAQGEDGEPDQVDAVAMNGNLQSRIIVGTTLGQIVQLHTATSDPQLLVPQHAMRQQRLRPINPGSIHILPSGAVTMLHHADHSLQAFDPQLGHLIGEWGLPRNGVKWLTLCGGGNNLFVLGLRKGTIPELYRFFVPTELRTSFALAVPPSPFLATKVP